MMCSALIVATAAAQTRVTAASVYALARPGAVEAAIDSAHGLVYIVYTEGEGPGMRLAEHSCGGELARGARRVRRTLMGHLRAPADSVACRNPEGEGAVCRVVVLGEYSTTLELRFVRSGALEAVIEHNSSYRSWAREGAFVEEHLAEARAHPCSSR